MSNSRFSYAAIVMLVVPLALGVSSALAQDFPRAPNGGNYSSLDQINLDNVAQLQMVWSRGLGSGFQQRTPQVHDGIVFLSNSRGFIQAIDAATGNLRWSKQVDSPDIHIDSGYVRVFDASTDGVRVLDATTGNFVEEASSGDWAVDTNSDFEEAPSDIWTGGGLVFRGDPKGWFYAVNHETDEAMWKINLGARQSTHFPATYAVDGRQYVAVNTNVLLHPDDPPGSTLFAFAVTGSNSECPLSESHTLSRPYVLYRDSPRPFWLFPFILTGGVEQIGRADPGPVTICEAVHRSTWSERFLWLRIVAKPDRRGWIKVEQDDDLETFLKY